MKISQKLISISIISTIFLIGVGVFGLTNMNEINSNGQQIYNNNLKALEKLYSTQSNINMALSDMEHILNDDFQKDISCLEKNIENMTKENNKLYKEYEEIPFTSEEEKEDYNYYKLCIVFIYIRYCNSNMA